MLAELETLARSARQKQDTRTSIPPLFAPLARLPLIAVGIGRWDRIPILGGETPAGVQLPI